ncbi:phenylpyruvate tautomerase PptA (4-oxalocrotonate tautomerase family) [Paenibacillus sp. V4I9]|uniref:hypothetical protein n=1 Tax=Paenibacillus sp. V4I9 TaxID=3042308 RepID=UPI00277FD098|nr:hypothetical protein [Paenibacillus sp. V4I9]MDQ0888859.1 phenylpyruvate tautomerase PptA (4-oxalocrotonate tautomerase family) [Paenibacillus sp. V4I9]
MKIRMIGVLSVVLVASAIAVASAQSANENKMDTEAEYDQVLAFQREAGPVVEGTVMKYFHNEDQITETITDAERLKYKEQLDWYWDNDNLQVVVVVVKEDAKEMKAIRKELEEKLGSKVKFVKSKITQTTLEMYAMSNELTEFIFSTMPKIMYYQGGYYLDKQRIEIKGAFTDEQVQAIYAKFDKKLVNITKVDAPTGNSGPTAF